jgi:hypothetical protein
MPDARVHCQAGCCSTAGLQHSTLQPYACSRPRHAGCRTHTRNTCPAQHTRQLAVPWLYAAHVAYVAPQGTHETSLPGWPHIMATRSTLSSAAHWWVSHTHAYCLVHSSAASLCVLCCGGGCTTTSMRAAMQPSANLGHSQHMPMDIRSDAVKCCTQAPCGWMSSTAGADAHVIHADVSLIKGYGWGAGSVHSRG